MGTIFFTDGHMVNPAAQTKSNNFGKSQSKSRVTLSVLLLMVPPGQHKVLSVGSNHILKKDSQKMLKNNWHAVNRSKSKMRAVKSKISENLIYYFFSLSPNGIPIQLLSSCKEEKKPSI